MNPDAIIIGAGPGGSLCLSAVKGLYVCDATVIPEAFGLPPTLTLLSLARRLADHLNQ